MLPNGDAALPLVGGFLWRGEDLTALEHSKFPITAAHETDGQKATIPVYFQGGRSILIPVDTFIHYKPLPSGGLELPAEAVANEDGYIKKRIVAFQYVGAGHSTYIRHFFKPSGRLADGQAYFSINGSETRSITDPRYWAKDGIFLDQRYQEATSAPTGAMVNCGEVVEMEKALLANGALIGAVTVGFVPLISKAELDDIVCGESGAPFDGTIDVQVKAIVDSTNRLDMLLCYGQEGKIKGLNSVPEDLVRALFAHQLESIAKTYFGEKEDSLERYLSRLGEVMGTNFRAAILSGLTIPWDGKPAENLSLTGMLCDVENCEACDAPYNFASMALQWIEILVSLSRTSDLGPDQSLTKMLEAFWRAALPGGDTDVSEVSMIIGIRQELAQQNDNEGDIDKLLAWLAAARITGRVVADVYSTKLAGLSISGELIRARFLHYCRDFPFPGDNRQREAFLVDATKPENWPTMAPQYYECLASLAISQFHQGQTPRIKWR